VYHFASPFTQHTSHIDCLRAPTYCRSFFLSFLCTTAHLTATTGLRDTDTSRNKNLSSPCSNISSPCSLINWAVVQVLQNRLPLCFMVITTASHYKYQFQGTSCHIAGQDGWWHTLVMMTLRLGFTLVTWGAFWGSEFCSTHSKVSSGIQGRYRGRGSFPLQMKDPR